MEDLVKKIGRNRREKRTLQVDKDWESDLQVNPAWINP
jgi:hypothetical protein